MPHLAAGRRHPQGRLSGIDVPLCASVDGGDDPGRSLARAPAGLCGAAVNPEMASALFAMIAAYSPELPGAVCVDPAAREIFDRVDTRATAAVAEAAWVCSRCPALTACRAWVEGLPPARRPRGVVGGLVIASRTGRVVA